MRLGRLRLASYASSPARFHPHGRQWWAPITLLSSKWMLRTATRLTSTLPRP